MQSDIYIEPFLGAGSVFFALSPKFAHLNDINADLITAFRVVRDQPQALIDRLNKLDISVSTYKKLAIAKPTHPIERATRMIYLNRTAFNGLYRVNRSGEFNVPFGCKATTILCDFNAIFAASRSLQGIRLHSQDFSNLLATATLNSVIYIDPPYPATTKELFSRYTFKPFTIQDQHRLAAQASRASHLGIPLVISNSCNNDIIQLYNANHFSIVTLMRASNIASRSHHRKQSRELLIVSRPFEEVLRARGFDNFRDACRHERLPLSDSELGEE